MFDSDAWHFSNEVPISLQTKRFAFSSPKDTKDSYGDQHVDSENAKHTLILTPIEGPANG